MALNGLIVKKIVLVRNIKKAAGERFVMVKRPYDGLVVTVEGECLYRPNGSEEELTSNQKNAIFLPKGLSYSLRCTETGHFQLIDFVSEGLGEQMFTVPDPGTLLPLVKRMAQFPIRTPREDFLCLAAMNELLAELCQDASSAASSALIAPSVAYIKANYCKSKLSLHDMAAASNISTAYFRELFRRLYGTSPMSFANELRLDEAKRQLIAARLPVGEIAERCGWSSAAGFSAYFKEKTGLTPKEYRASHTGEI